LIREREAAVSQRVRAPNLDTSNLDTPNLDSGSAV
jgi:hypothetical protein